MYISTLKAHSYMETRHPVVHTNIVVYTFTHAHTRAHTQRHGQTIFIY